MNVIQQAIEALERIYRWDELSADFRTNYGSNGERDHYRRVASLALASLRAAQEGDLPPLPEPACPAYEGVCCGNYATGASYMGDTEMLCCNNPDEASPDYYTADQMREYARLALAAAGGGVPPGYKLVPVEPTNRQIVMMAGALLGQPEGTADNRNPAWDRAVGLCQHVYRAVLAASPQPEAAKTPIGKKLLELREQAIANGMQLLSIDEINALRAPQTEAAQQWVPCRCFDETSRRLCVNKDRCSRVEAYNAPASGFGPKLMPQATGFDRAVEFTAQAQPEAAPADDVLEALELSPETFRTEGGVINKGKLRAAILHPYNYLPPDHWMQARFSKPGGRPLSEAAPAVAPAQLNPAYRIAPVDPTREMIDAGAQRLVSWGEKSTWPDSWDGLQVEAARTEADRCYRSMILVAPGPEAPAQAATSAGEAERVLRSFEITGPDADGLLWLVLHGSGTTGKAMFQLGLPDRLAGQVAMMLEQDRRAALATQPPAVQGEPKWRDIETAPKDGKVVLLGYHNSHGNWRTMRGCWLSKDYIDEYWEYPEGVDAGWFETPVEAEDPPNCWPTDPTHWMPLPPPPGIHSRGEGEKA